ncbi:MAG TPA: DUF4760 domain-containing protein [Candidatus Baltobacteraceae bacterium]|nr:DUF4760 domain-containing protein [Candidatus Baltobacteraceae bacterium]
MSAEWLTAVATAGTFVVIAASAMAALFQLRHMRGSNQIVALTECRETLESADFRDAQQFVSYVLPLRLKDPAERRRIAQPQSQFEGEYRAIDTVANFFENLGMFVRNRIIDRDLALSMWSFVILRNWNALAPVVTYVREDLNEPSVWEHFEYLAALSTIYMREHAGGSYPSNVPHMPGDRSFIEAIGNDPEHL